MLINEKELAKNDAYFIKLAKLDIFQLILIESNQPNKVIERLRRFLNKVKIFNIDKDTSFDEFFNEIKKTTKAVFVTGLHTKFENQNSKDLFLNKLNQARDKIANLNIILTFVLPVGSVNYFSKYLRDLFSFRNLILTYDFSILELEQEINRDKSEIYVEKVTEKELERLKNEFYSKNKNINKFVSIGLQYIKALVAERDEKELTKAIQKFYEELNFKDLSVFEENIFKILEILINNYYLGISEKIFDRLSKHKIKDLDKLYDLKGDFYYLKGNLDKAIEKYKESLKLRIKKFPENHPSLVTSYNNISIIYHAKGNYNKALEFASKALKIREQILDEDHSDLATLYNTISVIYQAKGEYDRALEYASKALKIKEQVLDENHPSLANSYNNISIIYKDKGDYDRALEYALKDLKIAEQVLDENHPNLANSYNNISVIYKAKGDYDRALEYALKALKIRKKVLDENHPDLANSYNNLAVFYYTIGKKQKAYQYICKAVAIWQKKLASGHPYLKSAVVFKANLERELGIK